jgi:hypothetical protein
MSNKENIYVRTPIESPAEITRPLPVLCDEYGNPLSPEEIHRIALEEEERIKKSKTN